MNLKNLWFKKLFPLILLPRAKINQLFYTLVSILILVIITILILVISHYIYSFFVLQEAVVLTASPGPYKKKPDISSIMKAPAENLVYETLIGQVNPDNNKVRILSAPEQPLYLTDPVKFNLREVKEDNSRQNRESDPFSYLSGNVDADAQLLEQIYNPINDHDPVDKVLLSLDLAEQGIVNYQNNNIAEPDNPALTEDEDSKITDDGSAALPDTGLNITKSAIDHISLSDLPPQASGGNCYVQIASAGSLEDALEQWLLLKQKYEKFFKNMEAVIRKVTGKNDRIFYLVMAGPYASIAEAKLICQKLTAGKQDCIVIK